MSDRRTNLGVAAPALALALCLLLAAPAAADTFKPTRKDDPTAGKCKPDNCSLREALIAANEREGRDQVVVGRGTYDLEIPNAGGPATGSVDLLDEGILRGRGPGKTTIDANGIDKAVTVGSNGVLGDSLAIRDLTVTGGNGNFGGGMEAVSFEGDTLALSRVAIKANDAAFGGGMYSEFQKLTITDSTISGNEASSHGGGMRFGSSSSPADAQVTIRGSRILGNEAPLGGGIYAFTPTLTITKSTIAGNAADEGGGMDIVGQTVVPTNTIRSSTISGNTARKGAGILADGNQPSISFEDPVATLVNSTVAGNQASADGGGIMADNSATMTLDNATVAYNAANSDGVDGGVGGGVYQHSGAVFGMGDSVVAGNTVGLPGTAQQCEGSFGTSDGLVRQTQTSGTCSFGGTFINVADAVIGPLADNGGPTQTVALRTGSPAIGFTDGCPGRDQRGKPRPDEDCDAGAFERKGP